MKATKFVKVMNLFNIATLSYFTISGFTNLMLDFKDFYINVHIKGCISIVRLYTNLILAFK